LISKGRVRGSTVQDGAVVLQHGTRVDGNSHPCIKGHLPKKRIFMFKNPLVNLHILYNTVLLQYIFSSAVKNKPREGIMSVSLFLGLLAWLLKLLSERGHFSNFGIQKSILSKRPL
jgi:hypothetical protein